MTPLHNVRWRKSSYSDNAAGCVELAVLDTDWRKSSHSNNAAGCVELAVVDEAMAVRDSKHPTGPALTFPTSSVRALLRTTPSVR